jgi:hypothetical protein
MNTKKVVIARTSASFSSSAQHVSTITLPRAPWEQPDERPHSLAEFVETPIGSDEKRKRDPRHFGPYKRNRKNNDQAYCKREN